MKNRNTISSLDNAPRIIFKSLWLIGLIVLLIIPLIMVSALIEDREEHQEKAHSVINRQYGKTNSLIVMLKVPSIGKDSTLTVMNIYPTSMDVRSNIRHKYLNKGRYDVLTYNADTEIDTKFSLRHIFENPKVYGNVDKDNIHIVINDENSGREYANYRVRMSADHYSVECKDTVSVQGVDSFSVVPLGDFSMSIRGDWPNPDFSYSGVLPTDRTVTDSGFVASWELVGNAGQTTYDQYTDSYNSLTCGVKLVMAVSQYQMVMRTVKYAMLIIILTFTAFFITELWTRTNMNIFQYLLAGLALVLFYSLLLSISEYIRFSYSYLIATSMILVMIFFYLTSVLSKWKPAIIITSMLSLLYLYIYILTQLETYSLLAGSIGFFVMLSLVMYASQRLIKLHKKNSTADNDSYKIIPPVTQ